MGKEIVSRVNPIVGSETKIFGRTVSADFRVQFVKVPARVTDVIPVVRALRKAPQPTGRVERVVRAPSKEKAIQGTTGKFHPLKTLGRALERV